MKRMQHFIMYRTTACLADLNLSLHDVSLLQLPASPSFCTFRLHHPRGVLMWCRPDYESCAALAELALNSSDCGSAHCVLGAPQPATGGEFIALAGTENDSATPAPRIAQCT